MFRFNPPCPNFTSFRVCGVKPRALFWTDFTLSLALCCTIRLYGSEVSGMLAGAASVPITAMDSNRGV